MQVKTSYKNILLFMGILIALIVVLFVFTPTLALGALTEIDFKGISARLQSTLNSFILSKLSF